VEIAVEEKKKKRAFVSIVTASPFPASLERHSRAQAQRMEKQAE
jgi:hypothetical protein